MQVAVLDDYQHSALALADWKSLEPDVQIAAFPDHVADGDVLARRLHTFECVVLMRERTPFAKALIERLPNLRLIVTAGMKNAAIDIDAATARGIQVCGTETLGTPTAELAWGLILALARKIPQEFAALKLGRWQSTLGIGLHGKTLGVIGLGRLGSQIARIGRVFGMDVIAWSQNLTEVRAKEAGATMVTKDDLFAGADIVTIHLVLGDRTRGLVGAAELGRMKPTAYLINTSRGPIVQEQALIAALKARRIAGAALDVFDREPLPAGHPLLALDNLLVTPHLGYVTAENYRLIYGHAVEDIRAFLTGKPIRTINRLP
ncbi:MAG: D-2-hydroxyacid dehydrogenase family protein [Alphaproteobacteria bacterium]|nr:D-2-hydroxyacid dehydrogenase family protein [Alphaproteobacteria bacterium]